MSNHVLGISRLVIVGVKADLQLGPWECPPTLCPKVSGWGVVALTVILSRPSAHGQDRCSSRAGCVLDTARRLFQGVGWEIPSRTLLARSL